MKEENAIEMFVGGLMVDPNSQAPVVILKDETGEVILPIWIGIPEATSIASALKQVQMSRPLTHDLMKTVFDHVGMEVQRVVIHTLKESTYYAELVVTQGDNVMILDSRPSDAIAMALRASAPIFVLTKVLEEAKILFSTQSSEAPEDAGQQQEESAPGEKGSDENPKGTEVFDKVKDFRIVEKDKWKDLLADLDPDDFKYKQ